MTILYTDYRQSTSPYEPFNVGEGLDLSDDDMAYLNKKDMVFKVPVRGGFVFCSGTGRDYIIHLLKTHALAVDRTKTKDRPYRKGVDKLFR